jgi:hypothetical protein
LDLRKIFDYYVLGGVSSRRLHELMQSIVVSLLAVQVGHQRIISKRFVCFTVGLDHQKSLIGERAFLTRQVKFINYLVYCALGDLHYLLFAFRHTSQGLWTGLLFRPARFGIELVVGGNGSYGWSVFVIFRCQWTPAAVHIASVSGQLIKLI